MQVIYIAKVSSAFHFFCRSWQRACFTASTGNWSSFISQAFSNQQLSCFISSALLGSITVPNLQSINPHEICVQLHAAAARMQLQWLCGCVSDVGFMRAVQLLLLFVRAVLEVQKHLLPFVAAWRRVCSTTEAIVQHTAHVLLMTTGYREAVGEGPEAAAGQYHHHIPRGHIHFAYRYLFSMSFCCCIL
jgi:hypothetical protein